MSSRYLYQPSKSVTDFKNKVYSCFNKGPYRTFYFATSNDQERGLWVEGIQRYIAKVALDYRGPKRDQKERAMGKFCLQERTNTC